MFFCFGFVKDNYEIELTHWDFLAWKKDEEKNG